MHRPINSTSEFVRLWTCHQAQVSAYISALVPRATDAAEVLQRTAVALWEKWAEYDAQQPFVPWAIRFAYWETLKWRQAHARERLVFSDALLEQLHVTYEEEAPLMEARQRALELCVQKLTPQEQNWLWRRYGTRGSLQENARTEGLSMHQIYYALEKIRVRLLQCISRALEKEGWSDA